MGTYASIPDAYPDTLIQSVKGGLITYTAGVLGQVNLATANFAANNTDPKATILTTYNSLLGQASPFAASRLKIQFNRFARHDVAGRVRDHFL